MQLGMIGLGRMGADMVPRLLHAGHECVVYDAVRQPVNRLVAEGAVGTSSLEDLVRKLDAPRSVWIMVPAASTGEVVEALAEVDRQRALTVVADAEQAIFDEVKRRCGRGRRRAAARWRYRPAPR